MKSLKNRLEQKRQRAHELVDLLMDKQAQILEEEMENGFYKNKLAAGEVLFSDFSLLEKCLLDWYYDHAYGAFCRNYHLNKPRKFDWDSSKNTDFDMRYCKENGIAGYAPYPLPYEDLRNYASFIFECKSNLNPNHFLYYNLAHAMKALNCGEIHSLVSPIKSGNTGNKYTLDFLRWASVIHVWAEYGILGYRKKHVAIDNISKELGVTKDQLISWEKGIGKAKDPDFKKREQYRKIAKLLSYRKKEDINGEWVDQYDDSIRAAISDKSINQYIGFVITYPAKAIKEYMLLAHKNPEKVKLEWHDGHWPKVILSP